MQNNFQTIYKSPLGNLLLTSNGEALTGLKLATSPLCVQNTVNEGAQQIFTHTILQLAEYFSGKRQVFTIPLALNGTEFQISVWKKLQEIPYNQTWSYKDLAIAMGKPTAFRAVGNANGKNPIGIIIPCHRVIQCSGNLGGYNGGVEMKRYLLESEMAA